MDLKLAAILTITALAASAIGNPVPPGNPTATNPKYVPVFISADALNRINEKDDQADQDQPEEGNHNDLNKEAQNLLYGPPAPVYEPDQHEPSYTPPLMPQNYQNNQQLQQQQYPNMQTPIQQTYQQPIQQQYQVQQPFQTQPNQIQQYPINQPQTQPFYPMNQQQNQPILLQPGSQPLYGNQQQIIPLGQQPLNQQPLLNQQQLIAQPIQTYQQPNQLISQPGNQQLLTQSTQPILLNQQAPMPNQQILLQPNQNGLIQQIPNQQTMILQPNQNGQIITSNPLPNQINPGYIQNQNQNMYAVVPIHGQNLGTNQNVGSNTYLVPVQQVPNQVFAVNSG
ncbi:putative mediator of RNA polymerase II transcription subunit 12 [Leguminivora glycinivorella]|uniref:putative mediator of RNA polymerase II transcription subunit 12 n=1 Tax=Leguminivora glycinivorella TaxID=1035111 RepID=UPI00200F574F|nr:putative mediator of RNA polymerase II transcription subunit 12 [Leguminivora glycinivorella]